MKVFTALSVVFMLLSLARGDVYMQNPRGSNDRLNEGGADRNNANRLFDSQNNARGGYCWGPAMKYYEGSILPVEWTAQHACGNDGIECNIVIQYMCQSSVDGAVPATEKIRDGTTTQSINVNNIDTASAKDANGNYIYGMHEPYQYYQDCKARSRNKGLFIAKQNIGNAAINTRQNNGATYGTECAEEKDYYPYFAPSPWKDIAVLTHDKDLCKLFKEHSQNVAPKHYCNIAAAANGTPKPAGATECATAGGVWTEVASHGLDAPDCLEAPWSRDNHLGNGFGGSTNSYNWTLPVAKVESCIEEGGCDCVLRIRYNISNHNIDGYGLDGTFTDATENGANSPITNNPYFAPDGKNLSLALNTNQYFRTFQDRTHMFKIISRDNSGAGPLDKIYNLNVRGKRGNIVQTFPATEYDFVPRELAVKQGDFVHYQWTGCDTNPANNAGEGTDKTDRSNIVQVHTNNMNTPLTQAQIDAGDIKLMFEDVAVRQRMAYIDQDESTCLTREELVAAVGAGQANEDVRNCMKLNAAPTPYFDGGLQKASTVGTFYFMSSRNNNFSNRTQRGTLVVSPLIPAYGVALIVIGAVAVAVAGAAVGGFVYAKKNPYSRVAGVYRRMPGPFGRI